MVPHPRRNRIVAVAFAAAMTLRLAGLVRSAEVSRGEGASSQARHRTRHHRREQVSRRAEVRLRCSEEMRPVPRDPLAHQQQLRPAGEWERYIKRMMYKPNSEAEGDDAKTIYRFLTYDSSVRKADRQLRVHLRTCPPPIVTRRWRKDSQGQPRASSEVGDAIDEPTKRPDGAISSPTQRSLWRACSDFSLFAERLLAFLYPIVPPEASRAGWPWPGRRHPGGRRDGGPSALRAWLWRTRTEIRAFSAVCTLGLHHQSGSRRPTHLVLPLSQGQVRPRGPRSSPVPASAPAHATSGLRARRHGLRKDEDRREAPVA
jgi:hypothetical protein